MLTLLISDVRSQILQQACSNSPNPGDCVGSGANGLHPLFTSITDTLLYIIGGIAVIMIIIGGLRFVLSGGNPAAAKSARETVLYAVIGLAIAVLGYAMVHFVFTQLTHPTGSWITLGSGSTLKP